MMDPMRLKTAIRAALSATILPALRPDFLLGSDKGEQGAVTGRRRHDNAAAAADTGGANGYLRSFEIGRYHAPRAAAVRHARQRHVGIALAELIARQEYEVGAVGARGDRDGAVRFTSHVAIDHLR